MIENTGKNHLNPNLLKREALEDDELLENCNKNKRCKSNDEIEIDNMIRKEDDSFLIFYYAIIYFESKNYIDKYPCPVGMIPSICKVSITADKPKTLISFSYYLGVDSRSLESFIETKFTEAFKFADSDLIKILSQYVEINFLAECLMEAVERKRLFCCHLIIDNVEEYVKEKLEKHLKYLLDKLGNLKACKVLLEIGLDPDGCYDNGLTYLMNACLKGYFELVKLLIERGSNINLVHDISGTALTYAISKGKIEIVKYLLEKGADPRLPDANGDTPLMYAAECSSYEIFSLIYEKDKDIHQKSSEGKTPLFFACSQRNVEIVKALVEAGADVNETMGDGRNCLHFAAAKMVSFDVLIYLMGKVENLDQMLKKRDNNSRRPLDIIAGHNDSSYLSRIFKARPYLYKLLNYAEPFVIVDNENKDICPICRDDYCRDDPAYKLPCDHIFHQHCVTYWLKINSSCPYCMKSGIKTYI